ncbi:MAG: protein jag [Psychrobacter sp.]
MNQEQTIEYAKNYVENTLSFFGVNLSVDVEINDDIVEISVPTNDVNSLLIGRNAETLRSLQLIVSSALRSQDAAVSRVNLDIADYKKQRADRLAEEARGWTEEVRRSGDSHVASLNAADRRVVHQVASEYNDIRTFSEGEGRDRKIIIAQASS